MGWNTQDYFLNLMIENLTSYKYFITISQKTYC